MQDTPIIMAKDAIISDILKGINIAIPHKGQRYPKDRNTKQTYHYLNIVTCFDIETSKEKYGPEATDWRAWMYIWQWQFGHQATVIGRTWDEFLDIVSQINAYLPEDCRLLVYVHNLAYEFQFISGIWNFAPTDVFATDTRSPLYCRMGNIELRCSLRLSNYSLKQWAKECRAEHQKMMGDLDYSIVRYPWTELTAEEMRYCVNDVISVVECVETMLSSYNDTLYTIPYTNTGYIRRRVKAAMRLWCHDAVQGMCGNIRTYDRLREAFRGGDTHANRWWVRSLIGYVYSYDRSSSYPDVICHCKFPMTAFREEEPSLHRLQKLVDSGRAVLMKVGFGNIRLRSDKTGVPYIPFDKCSQQGFHFPESPKLDNGRILSADYCELAMTDLDFEIIHRQYDWDYIEFEWMMSARYGYLPAPLVDVVKDLYKAKTSLKGMPGKEIEYNHAKAELNSTYGMFAQRTITNPIKFDNGKWAIDDFDREAEYNEAVKRAFVAYQWGVWVTAWARYRLHEGIWIAEKLFPERKVSSFRLRRYRFRKVPRRVGFYSL